MKIFVKTIFCKSNIFLRIFLNSFKLQAQELRLIRPQERRRPVYITPLRPPRPSPPNRRNVYTGQFSAIINNNRELRRIKVCISRDRFIRFTGQSRPPIMRPSKRPNDPKRRPTENECTFFTKTVCLEANDYPQ